MCSYTNSSYSYMSRSKSIQTNLPKLNTPPVLQNVINSGNVDRACSEVLEAAAVVFFNVKSKARLGLLNKFLPSCLIHLILFYLNS